MVMQFSIRWIASREVDIQNVEDAPRESSSLRKQDHTDLETLRDEALIVQRKRVFTTADGHLGLAPKAIEAGDRIYHKSLSLIRTEIIVIIHVIINAETIASLLSHYYTPYHSAFHNFRIANYLLLFHSNNRKMQQPKFI